MHTGCSSHLSNTADALLDLLGGNEHKVCKLVDDDNYIRHLGLAVFDKVVVIRRKAAHAKLGKEPVALEHLGDRPLERSGGLLRIGDNGDVQMRDAVINAELDHLGVYHDELDILGVGLIEQAYDKRVHAHRLARAGRSGDEQMRKLRDITNNGIAADILADGKGEVGLGGEELR